MLKKMMVIMGLLILGLSGFAQTNPNALSLFKAFPDEEYGIFILNQLAPGAIQIYQGKDEGYWYLTGTALQVAGFAVLGQNYIPSPQSPSTAPIGLAMTTIGGSLASYSDYAYLMDKGIIWPGCDRKTYLELAAAPWDYRNVFVPEILPVIAIAAIGTATTLLIPEANAKLADWYSRPLVNMWGTQMSPILASFIDFGWSLVAMTGTAIAEETLCRGIATGLVGTEWSAPIFGVSHLSNLLLMKPTLRKVVGTVLQAAFATCFGFYMDKVATDNHGDLSKTVAMHFWWNVSAISLGFLESIIYPEEAAAPAGAPASADPASTQTTPAEPTTGIDDVSLFLNDQNLPGVMLSIKF